MIAKVAALVLGLAGPAVAADVYQHVGPTPPPHGYPEIRSVALSTTDVRAGRPVHGTVETSVNVTYVEARIDYRNLALHQDAPGRFSLSYTVPWWLPRWARRAYMLQIVARTADGVELWRGVPITVR